MMKCPNCHSELFYIENSKGLLFVSITDENVVISAKSVCKPFSVGEEVIFNGTQCSWQGTIVHLVSSGQE